MNKVIQNDKGGSSLLTFSSMSAPGRAHDANMFGFTETGNGIIPLKSRLTTFHSDW